MFAGALHVKSDNYLPRLSKIAPKVVLSQRAGVMNKVLHNCIRFTKNKVVQIAYINKFHILI